MRKSVLITGASGYVGRITLSELVKNRGSMETIVAHDLCLPDMEDRLDDVIYVQGDIRSEEMERLIGKYGIDTVVHLVSIVTPQKGSARELAYSVDVGGTQNLLDACIKHSVSKLTVTTSGAAYGYYADSPGRIVETDALRGNPEFAYSDHKRIVEELLAEYRTEHPELQQLVLRPGTIIGATADNQITDMFKRPVIIGLRNADTPFVFIWDVDMARIIVKGICEENEGIYNVAGDGVLTLRQIAEKLKKPYLSLPSWVPGTWLYVAKKFGLVRHGPEQLDFLRYRPVLMNTKLKEDFGYIPTFTTEQAFEHFIKENPGIT